MPNALKLTYGSSNLTNLDGCGSHRRDSDGPTLTSPVGSKNLGEMTFFQGEMEKTGEMDFFGGRGEKEL